MSKKYIVKDSYPITHSDMGYLEPIFDDKGNWIADKIITKEEWDERTKR